MRGDLVKLVRGLNLVADVADDKLEPALAGLLRRAARAITELGAPVEDVREAACPQCNGPVMQSTNGRPRVWCSDRCRKAAAKERRKTTMSSSEKEATWP